MTDTLDRVVQTFDVGDYVTLFQLDARSLGGAVYYFTPSAKTNYTSIVFGGITYTPIDVEASGFEWSGQGALPQPKMRVANANLALNAAVITYKDLIGATVVRIRTFKQFLDGETDADSNQTFPRDVYQIERKLNHNKVFIEWQLSSKMDQEGKIIPGRQIIKDYCTHRYRVFDADETDSFNYDRATCPYASAFYFDAQGNVVLNASEDVCGKRLSDCRLRFGATGVLPGRFFPGVTKFV